MSGKTIGIFLSVLGIDNHMRRISTCKMSSPNSSLYSYNVHIKAGKILSSHFKVLSKNNFCTLIKGRNSVANLRKMMLYNPNGDLVNDNVYTNVLLNSVHSFIRHI